MMAIDWVSLRKEFIIYLFSLRLFSFYSLVCLFHIKKNKQTNILATFVYVYKYLRVLNTCIKSLIGFYFFFIGYYS